MRPPETLLAEAWHVAEAERVRLLVHAVGHALWSSVFGRPVEVGAIATEAASALYTLRAAVRGLREAQTPAARAMAAGRLLEVWPEADARLRRAVLLVLEPRHVRPLCEVLANVLTSG